ncbi:hypothetical protein FRC11_000094, partial [Ceratobasidium sp. 423]
MKAFLPAISDAGPWIVDVAHALLKFLYLAHSSSLTETDLCKMDKQLVIFHQHKEVFIHYLKTDRGFHNVPKFHMLQHYMHAIRMLGTPDGYNTEAPERLHINFPKAGFQASNKVAEDDCNLDDSSNTDEDTSVDEENIANGCVVEKVVEAEPEGHHNAGMQGSSLVPAQTDQPGSQLYYPNPEIVMAKKQTKPVMAKYLITAHGATNLISDVSTFLKKHNPVFRTVTLNPNSELEIWTIAWLYHERLPFKPLEPLKVDH